MKKAGIYLIIAVVVVLCIGTIPYVCALFSYRSQGGYLGRIDGVQYRYVLVDRTHFDSLKVLIFPDTYGDPGTRIRYAKLKITLDGRPVDFGRSKVMMLTADGKFIRLGWNPKWFVTSTQFNSDIYGLFGRVPHFKKYEVKEFNYSAITRVIQKQVLPKPIIHKANAQ